ncbi:enoyl-CoA hydratase-like protein [Dinothrombium tinctorium]|uniref:3-hydroxyisobutyryl-CoA hydrolase, mitochondrial n=1 Tax=Dinothrombium tinctorium TaxID=1965070 RepID=A0A3S3NKE7_9ACAR|nr:enoyl-CoA hydratase-like protein [Dinothrombium tinctorium]RWS10263.1 enoyl-CoA hydratase-like protein [Dinothrombium tinctorium]RWS10274.1 enoyl-CoA hydratase-like protein [Dinothrombium tinctorium]
MSTSSSSSSSSDDIILERVGNKGIITLNRPKQLNALNLDMIRKLYPQLRKWEMDNTMNMVLIKSSTDKAFCAGGDVKAIALSGKGSKLGDEFFREEYRLNNQIGSLSIPYVAFLDGIVMGGGVGLSVHGAFRIATEKATFAMPETAIGFFPDVGGSHFLPRLPGKLGLYLALTGYRLTGRDLFKAGIATHFIVSERLNDLEKDLLRLEKPDLNNIDKVLIKYQEQWEADYKKEFTLKPYIGRINSAFGDAKNVEQIFENLKRDTSEWAKQTLETLQKMSPTSLKVTFRELHEGANMSLPECLRMEYRISQKFMMTDDFFEGVRAMLVDKTHNPKWNPPTLAQVTDEVVNSYFETSPSKELQL